MTRNEDGTAGPPIAPRILLRAVGGEGDDARIEIENRGATTELEVLIAFDGWEIPWRRSPSRAWLTQPRKLLYTDTWEPAGFPVRLETGACVYVLAASNARRTGEWLHVLLTRREESGEPGMEEVAWSCAMLESRSFLVTVLASTVEDPRLEFFDTFVVLVDSEARVSVRRATPKEVHWR